VEKRERERERERERGRAKEGEREKSRCCEKKVHLHFADHMIAFTERRIFRGIAGIN